MQAKWWIGGAVVVSVLTGCDAPRGPRLAMTTAREGPSSESAPTYAGRRIQSPPPATLRYHGRTLEQWAQALHDSDPAIITRASRALAVLGSHGRPYLVQGLDDANPETRRICLEHLSVSDLKSYGERGRALLLRLAGDPADYRIRQRAESYVREWSSAIPAPP